MILFSWALCMNIFAGNKCPSNSSRYDNTSGWVLYAKEGTKGIIRKVTSNDEEKYFHEKAAPLLGGFWAPQSMAAPTTATCAYRGLTEPTIISTRYWLGKNIPLPKTMSLHNHYWVPDKEFVGQYICVIDQNKHECIYQ
jgi:hypothetical protein